MGGNYEESTGLMSSFTLNPIIDADTFDQVPQWGHQETGDLISIRAQLERDFTQTKRNKTLWEFVAAQMRERGYRRTADQCKCKWKNLVIRYKGMETSDPESGRQCPFFDELRAVFAQRHFLVAMAETQQQKNKKNKSKGSESSDKEDVAESDDERALKKRRSSDRERFRVTAEKSRANSMHDVLEDFFRQQHDIELQWRQSVERRERDRRLREQEWREAMENLERERVFMERGWREKEQQRRDREEARSEKRDALLSTLIARLIREDSQHTRP